MAWFPKIESPCPYKDDLEAIMDGSTCRRCKREVFDLTAMTDTQRGDFLASCNSEVCVSYKIPIAKIAATAAIASATMLAVPAAANEVSDDIYCYNQIIVGGLRKGSDAKMVELKTDKNLPDIPVMLNDEAQMDEFARMFGMLEEKDTKVKKPVKKAEIKKQTKTNPKM